MYPNLNDLHYFIEIARTGNVTQAAVRLGVTQPTLSVAIVRLENSLGEKILLRSKKGVKLTPAGRILLAHAKGLIFDWEKVQSKALASHIETKGVFKIGCHPSVAIYSLPKALASLLQENTELEITLLHDLSRKVLDEIIAVNIDIGIVVNPFRHPDLVIKKVCTDEVKLWHAQGSYNTDVIIADLDLLQTQSILKKFKKSDLATKRFIKSSNLEVITALTKAGAGLGLIPTRVAQQESSLQALQGSPIFKDEICLAYRMESRSIKAVQVIADAIQKAMT